MLQLNLYWLDGAQQANWTADACDMEWHSSGYSNNVSKNTNFDIKEKAVTSYGGLLARGNSYLEESGLLGRSVESKTSGEEERIGSHVKFLISSKYCRHYFKRVICHTRTYELILHI